MTQQVTPLENVPDLEASIVEKLHAGGITSVEALADMTPEQLEELPGIGPKTVEKISIAVNSYFSALEAAAAEANAEGEAVADAEAVPEDEAVAASPDAEAVVVDEPTPGEGLPGSDETPLPESEMIEGGGDDSPEGPDAAGMSGDVEGLDDEAEANDESVEELVEEGQYYEAEVVDGVENAPDADEGEVVVHERPETPQDREDIPDEELPGPQKTGLRD